MAGQLLLKDECFQIMGAAFEVYNELGCGFLESVYQEALALELTARGIPFVAQHPLRISYKNQLLEQAYFADFICYGQIIVELKALSKLMGREDAQVMNYLKATGIRVGLLLNYGAPTQLDWKRLVW